jgi:YggT family protein
MGKIIYWALVIYEFMIILAVFKSFIIYFSRNNRFSYFLSRLSFVDSLTDPYLNIFRKLLPPINGLDFSPMIGLVILQIIEKLVYTKLIIN